MNQHIQSASEYFEHSSTSTAEVTCEIFVFDEYMPSSPPAPEGFTAIEDVISSYSQDPDRMEALREARRSLAESERGDGVDTLRTLRLAQGMSQQTLADIMGTCQSHIARIEKGTDNPTFQTLKKLAIALGVDFNKIFEVIDAQKELLEAKHAHRKVRTADV